MCQDHSNLWSCCQSSPTKWHQQEMEGEPLCLSGVEAVHTLSERRVPLSICSPMQSALAMGIGMGQCILGTVEAQLRDFFLQFSPKVPRDPRGGNKCLPLRLPLLSTLIHSGQLGAEGHGKAAQLQVEGSPPHMAMLGSHKASHFLSPLYVIQPRRHFPVTGSSLRHGSNGATVQCFAPES